MTDLIFCPTETAGQISFKYASKEDILKTQRPPIYFKEETRFLYPAWAMWGETTLSENSSEIWLNFFILPAGYSASDYESDQITDRRRFQVIYQPSFNDRRIYFFDNQQIFEVEANSYGAFGQQFISLPGDKEALLNLINLFFFGKYLRIYTDFSPGILWKFGEARDGGNSFFYKTNYTLGEYTYEVACGGCKEDEFSVPDDNPKGYVCIPYEDIIEFSKQQRQRLNQIAKELK